MSAPREGEREHETAHVHADLTHDQLLDDLGGTHVYVCATTVGGPWGAGSVSAVLEAGLTPLRICNISVKDVRAGQFLPSVETPRSYM